MKWTKAIKSNQILLIPMTLINPQAVAKSKKTLKSTFTHIPIPWILSVRSHRDLMFKLNKLKSRVRISPTSLRNSFILIKIVANNLRPDGFKWLSSNYLPLCRINKLNKYWKWTMHFIIRIHVVLRIRYIYWVSLWSSGQIEILNYCFSSWRRINFFKRENCWLMKISERFVFIWS